jgi:hypothetical protein
MFAAKVEAGRMIAAIVREGGRQVGRLERGIGGGTFDSAEVGESGAFFERERCGTE